MRQVIFPFLFALFLLPDTLSAQASIDRFFDEMVEPDSGEENKEQIFDIIEEKYKEGAPEQPEVEPKRKQKEKKDKQKQAREESKGNAALWSMSGGQTAASKGGKKKKSKKQKAPRAPKEPRDKEADVRVQKQPKSKDKDGDQVGKIPESKKSPQASLRAKMEAKRLTPPSPVKFSRVQKEGSFKKLYKEGLAFLQGNQPYSAIEYLQSAYNISPNSIKLNKLLADAYFRVRDYTKSAFLYSAVLDRDPRSKKFPDVVFQLGLSEKGNGRYEEAMLYLQVFNRLNLKGAEWSGYKLRSRQEIRGCQLALDDANMGSPDDTPYETGLVKASAEEIKRDFMPLREDPKGNFSDLNRLLPMPGDEVKVMNKLYPGYSYMGNNPVSTSYFNLDKPYLGHYTKNQIGNAAYTTQCGPEGKKGFKCKIYLERLTSGGGTTRELLPAVNVDSFNSAYPFVAVDESGREVLYFASDRPGGKGGYDIWSSILDENGMPGKVTNLGIPVNTKGNEISPVFDYSENSLMFSSDGHVGYGGFDLYKAYREGNFFSDMEHFPFPMNSSQDEAFHFFDKEERIGYYLSNRADSSNGAAETIIDRIYEMRKKLAQVRVIGSVNLQEGDGLSPVDGSEIDVRIQGEEQVLTIVPVESGGFVISLEEGHKYELVSLVEAWEPVEKMLDIRQANWNDSIALDFIHKQPSAAPEGTMLAVIYFDFDQFRLRSDAPEILNDLIRYIELHPGVIIEIGGHTDSKGPSWYNQQLSEDRAKAVKRYFMSKGVASRQLRSVGYGEESPAVPNTTADGQDNEYGRSLNRRVEFKVAPAQ